MSDEAQTTAAPTRAESWLTRLGEDMDDVLLRKQMKPFEGIPGPTPVFPLGNAGDFLVRYPWEVLAGYAESYGTPCVFWTGRSPNIFINEPELIWQVLEVDFHSYYKDSPCKALLPLLTPACEFVTNGEQWRSDRTNDPVTVVVPPPKNGGPMTFSPSMPPFDLAPLRALLAEKVRVIMAATRPGNVDLRQQLLCLVFDLLSLELTGRLLSEDSFNEFMELSKAFTARLYAQFAPVELYPPVTIDQHFFREELRRIVREALREPDAGASDILHLTLRHGTPLDEETLAIQIGNGFFGGTLSTASGVLSTLYLLAQHPDAAARVSAELRALHARDPAPSFAALDACVALDHALLEALRLYPPAAFYTRNVKPSGPVQLGSMELPPNTTICITPWLLQRSSAHWDRPTDFVPERWADGGKVRDPLGSGYFFPFGRGRRACAGESLALISMKLVLAAILTAAWPEIEPPYVQDYLFGVLLPQRLIGSLVAR